MSLCRYFVSVFLIFACQNLFYAYCNAKAEYSYNVDISKFANKSFKDAGVSARKDSINSRVEMFGGIDFKIVNPSENGGKSVLSLDCSADSGKKISIPLDNFTHEGAISVYFLCNAKIDGKSAGENVGEVKVVVYDNYGKPMKSGALKIGSQIGLVGGGVFDSCKKISNSDLLNGNLYLCSFNIIAPWKSGVIPSSISIVPSGNGVINIFGITLSTKFVDTLVYFDFRESEWKAVDTSNLLVREGSALDVSKFMTEKPAGKYGRVVVSKYGHFEFENKPGVRVKFKSTNWRPSWNFSDFLSSKEKIDAVVSRIRAQGYNMVRWRCTPERSFEYEADFKCKSDIIDKYDYFLYACGREGVYSHFNLSSHDLGNPDFEWGDRYDVKIKMFFGDTQTREDWRKLVKMQLNLVNKYTGKKWKDDLSIATTEYYNEIELGPVDMKKASPQTKKFVDEKFVEPVFVVVVMCMAATRPIIQLSGDIINLFAKIGGGRVFAWWFAILSIGPLLGSFVTEPAAITICAALLSEKFFAYEPTLKFKYATIGILLVAVSAGGTLTHFSAPPVLMVAGQWGWGMPFMFSHFGWKAIVGIVASVALYGFLFRRGFSELQKCAVSGREVHFLCALPRLRTH